MANKITISYDPQAKAYTTTEGYFFWEVQDDNTAAEALAAGFLLLDPVNGVYFSAGGLYARRLIQMSTVNGKVSLPALNTLCGKFATGGLSVRTRVNDVDTMPVFITRLTGSKVSTFTQIFVCPNSADGFLTNLSGYRAGMFSIPFFPENYPKNIQYAAEIVNSWPQHPKAQAKIQKAIDWVQAHAKTFYTNDYTRGYMWIRGENLYTNMLTVDNRAHRGFEYPYIDLEDSKNHKVKLPFWMPMMLFDQGEALDRDEYKDKFKLVPFGNTGHSDINTGTGITNSGGATFNSSDISYGKWTGNAHFKKEPILDNLQQLDADAFNLLLNFFGQQIPTFLMTEVNRRAALADKGKSIKGISLSPASLATIAQNSFAINGENDDTDSDFTWSQDAEQRKEQLTERSADTAYRSKGVLQGMTPEACVQGSKYSLLYGMCASVADWDGYTEYECAIISGPNLDEFQDESEVSVVKSLGFDPASVFGT